jgi:aspartyl-tRNA(Asn)/glutamyl-tRNA(Gln) amidotransferase subunit C
MNSLSPEEIGHLATLSRLSLTEEESTHFAEQLGSILEYASHLPEMDVTPDPSHLRVEEDIAQPCDNPHDLLRNAIALENGYVKVPAILDKSES